MKLKYIIWGVLPLLALSANVSALPESSAPPGMMGMSATFAKARAQMRAYRLDANAAEGVDPFALFPADTGGCDVNVANVVLNDSSAPADDIVVFVQGDIIQANNCR